MLLCACRDIIPAQTTPAKHRTLSVAYVTRELRDPAYGGFIVFEQRVFPEQSNEVTVASVIETMRYPENLANRPAIGDDIRLESIIIDGNTVVVDFSEEYNSQSEMDKTATDAAVLLSLTDIDDIVFVKITAGGRGRAGRPDVYLTRNSFVFNDSAFE